MPRGFSGFPNSCEVIGLKNDLRKPTNNKYTLHSV